MQPLSAFKYFLQHREIPGAPLPLNLTRVSLTSKLNSNVKTVGQVEDIEQRNKKMEVRSPRLFTHWKQRSPGL